MHITLTELRYLIALDKERHFGRAAKRAFVSQPTLSVAVKKLEGELVVPLPVLLVHGAVRGERSEQLRGGALTPTTYVYEEGTAEWVELSEVVVQQLTTAAFRKFVPWLPIEPTPGK